MVDDKGSSVDDKDTGSGQKTTVPDGGQSGQTRKDDQSTLKNLPDSLKGKSNEEIVEMFVNLEKKMGEQSKDVDEARKLREQTDTLLGAIWSDPDLYRQVELGIQKYQTGGNLPEKRDEKPDGKKGDEGAQVDKVEKNPVVDDLKLAEENRILGDFFKTNGYNNLDEKTRKESYQKLSLSLAELVDPGGKRPIREILSSIPLSKLPRFLEHAHKLANFDMIVDQAKKSTLISNRENESATIGGFPASNGRGTGEQLPVLTNREREISQKMGITEEQYAKRKLQIQKEDKRFS